MPQQVLMLMMTALVLYTHACDTPTNRNALNSFYRSTQGPVSWGIRTNWNTTTHLSLWYGITCLGANVSSIQLARNQLIGNLSDSNGSRELGALVGLTVLQLEVNQLSGTLPAAWAAWGASIQTISLFANSVSGTLPSNWSAFSDLRTLLVAGNKLHGTLPADWSRLVSVETFSAEQNSLSGALPSGWSQWRNVKALFLHQNQLTGTIPSQWGSGMARMQTLHLHGNALNGPLPSSFSSMTQLQWIQANDNQLSGSLPWSWGSQLTLLRTVYLSNNNISGTLPSSWMGMASLQILDLSENRIVGRLPLQWPLGMVALVSLSLCSSRSTAWCGGDRPSTWTSSTSPRVFSGSLCGNASSPYALGLHLDDALCSASQSELSSSTASLSISASTSGSLSDGRSTASETFSKGISQSLSHQRSPSATNAGFSSTESASDTVSITVKSDTRSSSRTATPHITQSGSPIPDPSLTGGRTPTTTWSKFATAYRISATGTKSGTLQHPSFSTGWESHCFLFSSENCTVWHVVIGVIAFMLLGAGGTLVVAHLQQRKTIVQDESQAKEDIDEGFGGYSLDLQQIPLPHDASDVPAEAALRLPSLIAPSISSTVFHHQLRPLSSEEVASSLWQAPPENSLPRYALPPLPLSSRHGVEQEPSSSRLQQRNTSRLDESWRRPLHRPYFASGLEQAPSVSPIARETSGVLSLVGDGV
jgi:hypothetical protein